jgi:hypothetical protein
VSSDTRFHLPDREGSDAVTCAVTQDPLGGFRCAACPTTLYPASLRGGLWAATRPTVLCGPQTSSIKKSLADLSVQQGSPVPNARVHVFKVPDVRAIMGLQDVQAGSTVNACKTYRQTATMRR